ncbi:SDR family oxidoreductase [Paenibacillus macerans]|uniref:SDR family oxidoreductase n=1 Tax=Paenibacillus macerans TaxID=44252 RepID=UPI003D31DF39
MNKPETVLVTGGSGYVAGWCIVELLRRGYSVRTTVRNNSREQAIRAAIAAEVDAGERLSFFTADLTQDAGWDEAASGCAYVLHVASPLGSVNPSDAETLIRPAREGTLRVLRAAVKANVKRVVMTSACAAATPAGNPGERMIDESTWSDPEDEKLDAYRKSKALAEKDAWEFMKIGGGSTALTTILPGAVFGPVLSKDQLGSTSIIGGLLQGHMPGTPRIGFEVVDVRDLADIHIRAMTSEAAAGQRFIAVSEWMWMNEVSLVLRSSLGEAASKAPTQIVSDEEVLRLSQTDPGLRAITPLLGRRFRYTSLKAQQLLDWRPRPAEQTIVDCGHSLIAHQVV